MLLKCKEENSGCNQNAIFKCDWCGDFVCPNHLVAGFQFQFCKSPNHVKISCADLIRERIRHYIDTRAIKENS